LNVANPVWAYGLQKTRVAAAAWTVASQHRCRGRRLPDFKMEFNMMPSIKEFSIAIAVALGLVLAAPLSAPAFAAASQLPTTAQDPAVTNLHSGDLVHMRSGGPLMTVTRVQGDQVQCSWTDWITGELRSESFPVAVLGPQVTIPPDDSGDE
jgi:uncharacterized protein YodC (DUF2158 family)